jgi:lipid A ethanolaminephosphotransferase
MQPPRQMPPSTTPIPARDRRPALRPLTLNLAVTVFLLAAHNRALWDRAAVLLDGGIARGLFVAAVAGLTLLMLTLFSVGRLHRPWAAFLILVAALASFFADRLGVIPDREMLRNVLLTTPTESRHLLTPALGLHLLLWGVLPALALWAVRLVRPGGWRGAAGWALTVVAAAALGIGPLLADLRTFASVLRQHQELSALILPAAPVVTALRLVRSEMQAQARPVQPIGLDAHPNGRLAATGRPSLTVLVIGETLRAQNWGLNGYARQTTPELAQRDVVNFSQVESCGTSTAVSVPCMLSPLGMAHFSPDAARGMENLLDVAAHAGLAVDWWENNAGSYGLTARTGLRQMRAETAPDACDLGECTDEVFLAPFDQLLDTLDRDTLLVLHMIGSHGPAYALRYPPERARFVPACAEVDFSRCTAEEIRNAYDNTVLETDRVLAALIDRMAAQDRVATSLLFVSDHGESLGEGGLYLHGYPRTLAPETQTRVPMVLWLSEPVRAALGLSAGCLAARAARPLSHDAVFHTVLGLSGIETELRDPALDLVAPCAGAG